MGGMIQSVIRGGGECVIPIAYLYTINFKNIKNFVYCNMEIINYIPKHKHLGEGFFIKEDESKFSLVEKIKGTILSIQDVKHQLGSNFTIQIDEESFITSEFYCNLVIGYCLKNNITYKIVKGINPK